MAEIIPNEGLDLMLAIFPKNGTNLATSYVGLITGTLPTATAVLSTYTGVTEATTISNYARQSHAAAGWGSVGARTIWSQSTRGVPGTQVTFPTPASAFATPITGFLVCDALAHGSEKAIFYSDFVEGNIASLAIGDIVKVTPEFGLLG